MTSLKGIAISIAARLGYRIGRIFPVDTSHGLLRQASQLPGMVDMTQAHLYYWICFSQSIRGDVLEIGCWQGRSTVMLAGACRDAQNGSVHAVDHFQGNPGKSDLYAVGETDLSDLEDCFRRNIASAGLEHFVTVHAESSETVSLDADIRLLVIDAEHSRTAVLRDYQNSRHLLMPGAVVLFDDYTSTFPGVVEAVGKIHEDEPGSRLSTYGNMAVLALALEPPRTP